MKITPDDIRQKQFKTRFRGFDVREVDGFLEEVVESLRLLGAENDRLKDENARLELETKGYKAREETFKRAMLNAQKVIDDMKKNAHKAAEVTVAKAEIKAEKILNGAHNRLSQLHEDIMELKRQRMQIEVQIRSILEAHTKLLEIGKSETEASDSTDEKLKVLKAR